MTFSFTSDQQAFSEDQNDDHDTIGVENISVNQNTFSTADQHMPGVDQDTPANQDTSLTDCKASVASQVTSSPTATRVPKVM